MGPDWSTPRNSQLDPLNLWSASGYISAHVTFSGKTCAASGIRVAEVVDTYSSSPGKTVASNGIFRESFAQFIYFLRPSNEESLKDYKNGHSWTEATCRTLLEGNFSDCHHHDFPAPDIDPCVRAVELLWMEEPDDESIAAYGEISEDKSFVQFHAITSSLMDQACFVKTRCGYVGRAPADTRSGDVICIFLGCSSPILLRRTKHAIGDDPTWLVVGRCYVHGIMDGELIYQHPEPLRYRSCTHDFTKGSRIDIDGLVTTASLYDTKTDTYINDPTVPLTTAGIKIESYESNPHKLVVLPETLRAAGVAVEDFVLL
ncbi:hypothetical protein DPSP01_006948 [Paraphaeosphaeria sporulosa]